MHRFSRHATGYVISSAILLFAVSLFGCGTAEEASPSPDVVYVDFAPSEAPSAEPSLEPSEEPPVDLLPPISKEEVVLNTMKAYLDEKGYRDYSDFDQAVASGLPIFDLWLSEEEFTGENGIWTLAASRIHEEKEHIKADALFYAPGGELKEIAAVELSMHGNGSLGLSNKSMRLYYDESYGEGIEEYNPKNLKYPLFGEDYTDASGDTINKFKTVILRSGGNDAEYTMMRDLVAQRICKDLHCDTQAGQPVILYVNGHIFGTYNAREKMDDRYVENHYGVDRKKVTVLEVPSPLGSETKVNYEVVDGEQEEADAFNALLAYAVDHSAADEAVYKKLEEAIDFDSLIDMCCAELFFANTDWPGNNVRVYRYTGDDVDTLDHKWHFMLVDLDMSYGWNSTPSSNYFYKITKTNTRFARLMQCLFQNAAFKERFAERFNELLDTTFTPENTLPIWDAATEEISWAIQLNIIYRGIPQSYDYWKEQVEQSRTFLSERTEEVRAQVSSFAGGSAE